MGGSRRTGSEVTPWLNEVSRPQRGLGVDGHGDDRVLGRLQRSGCADDHRSGDHLDWFNRFDGEFAADVNLDRHVDRSSFDHGPAV